jgi:hypothetical protein
LRPIHPHFNIKLKRILLTFLLFLTNILIQIFWLLAIPTMMVLNNTIWIYLKEERNQFQTMRWDKVLILPGFQYLVWVNLNQLQQMKPLKASSLTEELRLQFLQMKILKMLRKEDSFNLDFILTHGIQKRLTSIVYQIRSHKSTEIVMNTIN